MFLDDAEEVLSMAWSFGAVMVFQDTFLPKDGFTIGGNGASGGANLHVGVQEDKKTKEMPLHVKRDLGEKCCLERWFADLLQVWDLSIGELSPGGHLKR